MTKIKTDMERCFFCGVSVVEGVNDGVLSIDSDIAIHTCHKKWCMDREKDVQELRAIAHTEGIKISEISGSSLANEVKEDD